MTALTCPGCGAVYPLSAVQTLDTFRCSMCHHVIVVPSAGPSAARAAPVARPAPPPPVVAHTAPPRPVPRPAAPPPPVHRPAPASHAPHAHAPHARPHARAAHARGTRSGPNTTVIVAAIAFVACGVVAAILLSRETPEERAAAAKAAEPPPAPVAPPPVKPKSDPTRDPTAWKELASGERADRCAKYLASLDRRDGEMLSRAFTFLRERDETDAMRKVAEWEFARDPTSSWARKGRGDVMVSELIERVLAECPRAEEVESRGMEKLNRLRRKHAPEKGLWWAEPPLAKELDSVFEEIRADEKALASSYAWACAKWALYQRRIEVMREHAAITGTVGPYLIFVQVKAPPGTPLESVPEIELNRAKRVLSQNQTLFAAFYDGFHQALGGALGVGRYEPASIDEKTLLKANIFADESTWELYHERMGYAPWLRGVRAYYQHDEPRFIVSHDPGGEELSSETDQVQCHEATHQLLHFYTWDVTRKAEGVEPAWALCDTRPPWLDEGFCEHFSSHRREGGKYVWMQPLEGRMRDLWVFEQVFQKKRWAMWSLDEMLAIANRQQIDDQAARRVLPRPVKNPTEEQQEQVGLAVSLFGPVFYSKAWSLVHFLWHHADASGRPVHRDRFLAFLKGTLRVRRQEVPGRGPETLIASAADFRKAMGLESETSYRAFEKEWLAWEKAFLAKAQKADWPQRRDGWLARLGIK